MQQVFKILFMRELRERFPGKFSSLFQFINELAGLFFISYTAKAFLPNTQLMKGLEIDYFSFIIVGECFFRPLLAFVFSFIKNMKEAVLEGRVEQYQIAQIAVWPIWMLESLPSFMIESLRVSIIFLIATIFFNLRVGHLYFAVPLWLFLSLPLFTGLGLISNRIVGIFKKGESFIYKLIQVSIIMAGAYFPTNSLPESLQKFAPLFPLAQMMDSIRRAQMNQNFLNWCMDFIQKGIIFFVFGIFVMLIGIYLPKISLWKKAVKRERQPLF